LSLAKISSNKEGKLKPMLQMALLTVLKQYIFYTLHAIMIRHHHDSETQSLIYAVRITGIVMYECKVDKVRNNSSHQVHILNSAQAYLHERLTRLILTNSYYSPECRLGNALIKAQAI
jgi:hypothetical protein